MTATYQPVEHIDGHNKIAVSEEPDGTGRIRVECWQRDIHDEWQCVYSAIHPANLFQEPTS